MTDDERDAVLARATEELRRPVVTSPWLDQRIMRAVRAARPRRAWAGWLAAVLAPRISLSPVAAAALAILLAGGGALVTSVLIPGRPTSRPGGGTLVVNAATRHGRTAQFVFADPGAVSVTLVGDFNDWDASATPLQRDASGLWSIEVALPPGQHRYAFVVDGLAWLPDPEAPHSAEEDFGHPTSVRVVPEAAS